jgi:hypothetical protein
MTFKTKAPSSAPSHLAVWIDHRNARLIPLARNGGETIIHNRTAASGNIHHKAGTAGAGHDAIDHTYLHDVVAALGEAQEILILGPADAKIVLRNYMDCHALARRVLGVEAMGHATEGEIRVFAAEYFLRMNPVKRSLPR